MSLRQQLAIRLRGLAQALDGREFMDAKWHKASVAQMNSYIERTEDALKRLRESNTKHPEMNAYILRTEAALREYKCTQCGAINKETRRGR